MIFYVSNIPFITTEAFVVVQTVSPTLSLPRSSPRHLLRRQTSFRPLLLSRPLVATCGTVSRTSTYNQPPSTTTTVLAASAGNNERTGKKKRRRKQPPAVPLMDPVKVSSPEPGEVAAMDDLLMDEEEPENTVLTKSDVALIDEIAKFEFQTDKDFSMRAAVLLDDDSQTAANSAASITDGRASNAISLPDIKEARKKKQMEEELARMEQEKEEQKVRIKRSDKAAFARVR